MIPSSPYYQTQAKVASLVNPTQFQPPYSFIKQVPQLNLMWPNAEEHFVRNYPIYESQRRKTRKTTPQPNKGHQFEKLKQLILIYLI